MALLNNTTLVKIPDPAYIDDEMSAVNLSNDSLHFANSLFNASPDFDLTWQFETDLFDIRLYTRPIMESKINLTYSIVQIDCPPELVYAYLKEKYLSSLFQHQKEYDYAKKMSSDLTDTVMATHATSYEGIVWANREWCDLHTVDSRNMQIVSTSCLLNEYNDYGYGLFQYILPIGKIRAQELHAVRVEKLSETCCKVLGLRWSDMGGAYLPAFYMTKYLCDMWTRTLLRLKENCEKIVIRSTVTNEKTENEKEENTETISPNGLDLHL